MDTETQTRLTLMVPAACFFLTVLTCSTSFGGRINLSQTMQKFSNDMPSSASSGGGEAWGASAKAMVKRVQVDWNRGGGDLSKRSTIVGTIWRWSDLFCGVLERRPVHGNATVAR